MARDHRKLDVFKRADELVLKAYAVTAAFPPDERFGLCSQIRKAAVSVPANIVEGCARRTTREYLNFINISIGSAAETLYLIDVSCRLRFLGNEAFAEFETSSGILLRQLQSLHHSLSGSLGRNEPEARSPASEARSMKARSPKPGAYLTPIFGSTIAFARRCCSSRIS
jgi:four helix bundle protein